MKVLVWQWGRRGAGPRCAAALADGLRLIRGVDAILSLSSNAEILHGPTPPHCEMPIATYTGVISLCRRLLLAPIIIRNIVQQLKMLEPDLAICAMPAPLDLLMLAALRRTGIPVIVIVHDANPHPGDSVPLLMNLQRRLTHKADVVAVLSSHVAGLLRQQGVAADKLIVVSLPSFISGPTPLPPGSHGGAIRLLCFGRLLPYKGLDLLADAIRQLHVVPGWELRVVGSGPESKELATLRALPGVTVENRWVSEEDLGGLLAWADILVLPYKEASQSGVAPAAIAAGRFVVSTRVGGLVEQLEREDLATLCEPNGSSLFNALRDLLLSFPAKEVKTTRGDSRLGWKNMAVQLLSAVPLAARNTQLSV